MENQFLHDCNSFVKSGLVAGGKDSKEARQAVFFWAVDAMNAPQEGEPCDVTKLLEVTLLNEMESVPACSILDPSENCSRQRMSMFANTFQCLHS